MGTLIAVVINSAVGAGKNHLGLFNGLTSGRVLEVWRVEVVNHLTAVNTGTAASFNLSRTTAAGAGTAAAVRKADTRDDNPPSQVSALHTFTTQPTLAANPELASQAVYTEETTGQTGKEPLFQADPSRGIDPVRLRGGEGVAVQQAGQASAGAVNVFVYFKVHKG